MITVRCLFLAALATVSLASSGGAALAGEWDLSGSAAVELRVFPEEPAFAGQDDAVVEPSTAIEPEVVYDSESGDDRFTVAAFARWDRTDGSRSHADLRAANWLHLGESWDLVVGIDKVYWGVTESRHLVNIINQDDAVEDIDGEDKLGQPMVNLNIESEWGTLGLYVLPGFRERRFPAANARLRGPLPIDEDAATFDSGAKQAHVDFAARWAATFGDWDVGVAHFSGTSREPRLIPTVSRDGLFLAPHYDLIEQTSLDVQLTRDAWLWKLEAITRSGQGDRFAAAVGGVEYTLFDMLASGADLGLIAEYLYDGRDTDGSAPLTPFENDVFAGVRLALNDAQSTQVLAGAIVDADTGATLLSIEGERRLADAWKLEIEGRFFVDIPDDDPLAGIRNDDFATLRLTRFF